MERLIKLYSACAGEVELSINSHRGCYESTEYTIRNELPERLRNQGYDEDDIAEQLKWGEYMIRYDTVVELNFYPNTPTGFYTIYHYDVEMAIEEALTILDIK